MELTNDAFKILTACVFDAQVERLKRVIHIVTLEQECLPPANKSLDGIELIHKYTMLPEAEIIRSESYFVVMHRLWFCPYVNPCRCRLCGF